MELHCNVKRILLMILLDLNDCTFAINRKNNCTLINDKSQNLVQKWVKFFSFSFSPQKLVSTKKNHTNKLKTNRLSYTFTFRLDWINIPNTVERWWTLTKNLLPERWRTTESIPHGTELFISAITSKRTTNLNKKLTQKEKEEEKKPKLEQATMYNRRFYRCLCRLVKPDLPTQTNTQCK